MSTVAEIEAVLPGLTAQDLERVESLARNARRLTFQQSKAAAPNPRLAAFEALQRRLALDEAKARAWQDKVREARR